MLKDNTPTFVRFLILISMAVLLGLFTLPPNSLCSTGKGSKPDGPNLVKERLPYPDRPDRKPEPFRKVVVIKQGDHFSGILEKEGLSAKDALYVSKRANKVFKLNKMRPGSELEFYLTHDGTGLQEVDYKVNNRKRLVLYNGKVIDRINKAASITPGTSPKTSTPHAAKRTSTTAAERIPSGARTAVNSKSSLQASQEPASHQGTGSTILMVASYTPGLHLNTVHPFQECYGLLSDGKVLSPVMIPWDAKARSDNFSKRSAKVSRNLAKSSSKKASRKARLVRNSENKRHSEDGFLKVPLTYRCISSGYTSRRIHPITNNAQPHYGIDYAAPRGTPVHSIGTGTIIYAGWDGGFGKTIRIRHKNGYVSHYGHLTRYAKGMRAGKKVKRGETVGFVGMTGIATGPHLDFRVTYQGSFINPANLDKHFKRISGHTSRKTQG